MAWFFEVENAWSSEPDLALVRYHFGDEIWREFSRKIGLEEWLEHARALRDWENEGGAS